MGYKPDDAIYHRKERGGREVAGRIQRFAIARACSRSLALYLFICQPRIGT